MWQPIETYPKPLSKWDYNLPKALFFSEETGPVIGRCVLMDGDEKECAFEYDREGRWINPTHWMPLPPNP